MKKLSVTTVHLRSAVIKLRDIADELAIGLNVNKMSDDERANIGLMIDGIEAEITRGHAILESTQE